MREGRMRIIALMLCLAWLLGCAGGPARQKETGSFSDHSVAYFDQREIEMGRQIHQAIVSSFRIYTEPRLVRYVRSVGRSVARRAKGRKFDYQFTILYDARVYATEAPGGYVYITTGFLNFLQNEAELASLLAQEVALLQFRSPRFSNSRKMLRMAAQTGAVAAPFFGPFGTLAATGLVLLHSFAEAKEGDVAAKMERVDRMVLRYLVEAGQDPQGYLDLVGRLLNPGPAWSPYSYDYLSSHPVTLQRVQSLIGEFEKLPLEDESFDTKRSRYLEITKGVREIYSPP